MFDFGERAAIKSLVRATRFRPSLFRQEFKSVTVSIKPLSFLNKLAEASAKDRSYEHDEEKEI
jgi:hypothetical protein